MPDHHHCTQCGVVLTAYAVEGLCGRCLLKPGLGPAPETSAQTAGTSWISGKSADSNPGGQMEAPIRFGDYELLQEVARGGMGVVYRARQVSLDRIVAVKMLLAGPLAGKDFVLRFRTEASAAASLQHPNIVGIHEVGFAEGQHFFAMDFVNGLTLAQMVARGPLPATQAAAYLKTVAEAIQFAHGRNVLHRDLKPSNVLVDSETNQPRVTDFGLAKRLESETDLTLSGQLLGSPNYMSPEQAKAKRGTVGRCSDVYSLGAILYHLLTGRPPFQGETLGEVLSQVADNDPLAPHLLIPEVPPDLETICLKSLEKEPVKRYQTAQEVAEELGRFLRLEPIHARPTTRAERLWRWCRRKPTLAGLLLLLHLVLALGLAGILWQWRRALISERHAAISESQTRRNLYTADMNLVQQTWDQGNLQEAQALLELHRPQPGKADLRGFEWGYLSQLCRDESRATFTNVGFAKGLSEWRGHHGLALAADGDLLIAASGASLKWLDCRKQLEVQSKTVGMESITELAMAAGQPGLVAYRTDRVNLLSPTGESLLGAGLAPELGADAFALSWDGSLLAVSSTNSSILLIDVKTCESIGPDFNLGDDVSSFAFSPNAKCLACGTFGTKIHILEVPRLNRKAVLTNHTAFVTRLAFAPNGKLFASGCNDSHVRVWRFPDCTQVADLTGHHGMIGDLAFSPDSLRLASSGLDHTVRLWNLANLEFAPILFHGHRGGVKSVLFSRTGNQLYTGSDDQTVKLWDSSPGQSTNILRHAGYTADVAFSPDGKLVAAADYTAKTAVLWRVLDQSLVGNVGKHPAPCTGVKFSPNGRMLATVGGDAYVRIWSLLTREKLFDFPTGGSEGVIAFHPFRNLLAVASGDLRFCDLQYGTAARMPQRYPTNHVIQVCFSPNGKWIALGMQGGEMSVWDFITGQLRFSLREHSAAITSLCFSHDGKFVASGGLDRLVIIYSLSQQGPTVRLEGHTLGVYALAFAPDDKTLVSTSWDGFIRFWSLSNHKVALTLAHDGGPVTSVAFSPNGDLMATSGSDRTIRLWPAKNWQVSPASKSIGEIRK